MSEVHCIGVDFGTTNSVLTRLDKAGELRPMVIRNGSEAASTLRTVLGFQDNRGGPEKRVAEAAGAAAIAMYLDAPDETRFLQSIKSHAASKLFTGTQIHGVHHDFEDLIETFFRCAWRNIGLSETDRFKFVVGRPVRFAGGSPDDELAMNRYKAAFSRLGAQEIMFVHEPVAAAFYFARRLTAPATVLVADFGGGTTDFSIVRFDFPKGRLVATPLAKGGIGIAGDLFDQRILENVVLPQFGRGFYYKSMGRRFPIPNSLFSGLARWETSAGFRYSREYRELRTLRRLVEEPRKLDQLFDLVDNDDGYGLYRAVSDLKADLSSKSAAILKYENLSFPEGGWIRRSDFEEWIANDIERMDSALDQTLHDCGVSAPDIDRVFLTGGTSFVPAVRRLFERRFPSDIIETGDELQSISKGLAMIGARQDARDWAAEYYSAS